MPAGQGCGSVLPSKQKWPGLQARRGVIGCRAKVASRAWVAAGKVARERTRLQHVLPREADPVDERVSLDRRPRCIAPEAHSLYRRQMGGRRRRTPIVNCAPYSALVFPKGRAARFKVCVACCQCPTPALRDRIAAEAAAFQLGSVGLNVGAAARQGKRATFCVGSVARKQ